VIKKIKKVEDTVLLDRATNPLASYPKKPADKHDTDSLNFMKTITTEITNLHESLSQSAQKQAEYRKKELERVYNEAKNEGYKNGFDDALNKERSEQINAIDMLLKEAKKKSENAIRGLELKVIDLAVYLAEQITHKNIDSYPEIVEGIIHETMSYLIGNETVILKVSEHDFKIINNKYDKWMNMAGSTQEFRLEVDRRLKPGDCVIETEGGIIDAVVANRLDMLAEELAKVSL
jgi:flagellar assembly protein FliH